MACGERDWQVSQQEGYTSLPQHILPSRSSSDTYWWMSYIQSGSQGSFLWYTPTSCAEWLTRSADMHPWETSGAGYHPWETEMA
jgi:hypothetical protein